MSTEENTEAAKEDAFPSLLREAKRVVDKHGVEFWLDSGTLLGAVRDGKIIPWEHDIDLATWYTNSWRIVSCARSIFGTEKSCFSN